MRNVSANQLLIPGQGWSRGEGGDFPRRGGRGRSTEGAVGPDSVAVLPLPLDHGLGLVQRVEALTIQELIPQLRVKRLAVTILPGAAPVFLNVK
jgi:hypothetical protein